MTDQTTVHDIEFWFFVVLFRALLDWTYKSAISVSYAYAGFENHMTAGSMLLSWLLLLLLAFLVKRAADNREDRVSFEVIYVLFLLSGVPMTSMAGFRALDTTTVILATIYWLLFLLLTTRFTSLRFSEERLEVRWSGVRFLDDRTVMILAVVSALVVLYISGRYTHFRINLRLDRVYDLRAEARSFQLPTWLTYAFAFSRNINALMIAYYLRRKKPLWTLFCFGIQILNFGIDGSKTTLFLALFAVVINLLPAMSFKTLNRCILIGMSALTGICMLLYKAFRMLMPVSLFVRRLMFIPCQITGYYVDFFTHHVPDYFQQSFLRYFGFHSHYDDLPYMIGRVYLDTFTSANNGLVSDAVANLGLPGLLVFPFLLLVVFRAMDCCARGLDRRLYITVALYAAVTLTNSFLFTTLITHGLLVSMILLAMMEREKENSNEDLSHDMCAYARGYSDFP